MILESSIRCIDSIACILQSNQWHATHVVCNKYYSAQLRATTLSCNALGIVPWGYPVFHVLTDNNHEPTAMPTVTQHRHDLERLV